MKVYVFTSENLTNIWAGVGASMWAVPLSQSENSNKGRRTKASKMPIGAFGLLYCSSIQSFTVPFMISTQADPERVVENVWPGKWILPFAIQPLGTPHRTLSWTDTGKLLPSCQAGKPLNQCLHVEPLTVFTADNLTDDDWSAIVQRLASAW